MSLLLALAFAVVPLLLPPPAADSAEVRFLRMMLPHHAQAVTMVEAAGPRLRDPEVQTLARTIRQVQEREIGQMEALLRAWGHPAEGFPMPPAHAAAMGMATPADLNRLGTLPPAEAERLFLQLMRRHHEGALAMAGPLLGWWVRPQVRELARHVELMQKTEVRAMDRMLRARGVEPLPLFPSLEHQEKRHGHE
ncbi:DUF305 domain-containing protein [Deinococcus sp. SDU3-2]|uniref:DUF305 domain-containing protein n=1 Tax=Deinococcus terrestris TaxID=2651870 RepID=A0A7X1NWC3_9DEIO|nr:DUF305 domain-containing protein [Deinococcus terrestris]MPY66873.1 DUF305 domain-containing protein [Deinococcus terrestris]